MKNIKTVLRIIFLFTLLATQGCYYDKQDKLRPKTGCDTAGMVTYTSRIKPILDQNCTNSCHGGSAPLGGINLDSYASAKSAGTSGKLYSSVTWDGATSKMPKGGNKLDDCTLMIIKKWIDSNYPQ